jgi:hypothetical protein
MPRTVVHVIKAVYINYFHAMQLPPFLCFYDLSTYDRMHTLLPINRTCVDMHTWKLYTAISSCLQASRSCPRPLRSRWLAWMLTRSPTWWSACTSEYTVHLLDGWPALVCPCVLIEWKSIVERNQSNYTGSEAWEGMDAPTDFSRPQTSHASHPSPSSPYPPTPASRPQTSHAHRLLTRPTHRPPPHIPQGLLL